MKPGSAQSASQSKRPPRTSSDDSAGSTTYARPALKRTAATSPRDPADHLSSTRDDSTAGTESSSGDESQDSQERGSDRTTPTAAPGVGLSSAPPSRGRDGPSPDEQELAKLRAAINRRLLSEQQRAAMSGRPAPPSAGRTISGSSLKQVRGPSPITEESPQTTSIGQPSSTDSTRTIRMAPTPGAQAVRTPSYPFPSMNSPRAWSPAFHQPFTVLSPTTSAEPSSTPGDSTTSGASTPGANFASFAPPGSAESVPSDPRYPNPNLYDVVLQLSAEPGLEAWWNTVTKILHDSYLADRVSLALPADANDIENVPWGQKATFNVTGHDDDTELSNTSSPQQSRFSSQLLTPGEQIRTPRPHILNARPGLESRHSYTGVPMTLKDQNHQRKPETPGAPGRPGMPVRTVSHMPSLLRNETTLTSSTGFTPMSGGRHASLSDPDFSSVGGDRQFIPHVSVFPVLRGLGTELDNLIDATGVNKVLERGNMVTLTRDYTQEQAQARYESKESSMFSRSMPIAPHLQKTPAKTSLPYRSIFSTTDSSTQRRGSAYEEYEQQPPSPWSQSPAPSPAIQADPDENPFFAGDSVEDTFDPPAASPDYSNLQAIEAIGVDKANTVIHLPLIHPTLSALMPSGGEDSRAGSTQSTPDPRFPAGTQRERRAPIAIISILSPAVPYPQNLTQSLKMLGPHLAVSYSNAQQLTAVQMQAWGMRHRRGASGRASGPPPLPLQASNLDHLIHSDFDETAASNSGSITSPSDYSGRSRHSPGSSIAGTPGWENILGSNRSVAGTPAGLAPNESGEGYFEKRRGNTARSGSNASGGMSPNPTPVKSGRKSPNIEARSSQSQKLSQEVEDRERRLRTTSSKSNKSPLRVFAPRDHSPPRSIDTSSPRRANIRHSPSVDLAADNADRFHSVLHSYGADFSSSFQSLPASAIPKTPGGPTNKETISAEQQDMPPPSERLLRTIIDSLPVQIFTAAPGTGDLTWVNSKFLVYRGQDSRQVLKDPWNSIHPEDRHAYMDQWSKSLRTGQQLQQKVRLQRFDGNYRWFYVRAAPLKDKRQSIVHWIGTNMDFHEQHTAELNAARQQETAASEAKYRALANSSPQVVFTVNRAKGITFCNTQWHNYAGQPEAQALGLGFMEHVHPDDIVKCRLPSFDDGTQIPNNVPVSVPSGPLRTLSSSQNSSSGSSDTEKPSTSPMQSPPPSQMPQRKLSELALKGILKVTRDTDGRASYSTEVRLRSKDGEYRWYLVRVVLTDQSLRSDDDEEEEEEETWYGTCTDINDHKTLERDLKETMDEKSRFLSNMSHEIRTPLNGITGMVNFLIDSKLTDEQMEHVNIIRASTEGLRGLINDILDLSKAEAGMIQLSIDWVHVRSLIEEVNDLTSAMAIDKGLELNYLVEPEVPAQIKGDRFRVRQILLNVIGNAIKFTQTGEVFVKCSVLHNTDNNEHPVGEGEILIQFEVIDTGRGFTEKEAQYLFKRFSQIDGSSTRQHGGTGLGLVISRQLAQLHGGDMSAKGVPGKGATFIFYIKGNLPSPSDQPPADPVTPGLRGVPSVPSLIKQMAAHRGSLPGITGKPLLGSPLANEVPQSTPARSPIDPSRPSPSASISSSSSGPSTGASRTSTRSEHSSASSMFPSDATIPARMSIDMSMLEEADKITRTDSQSSNISQSSQASYSSTGSHGPPPMFSILVVCPLKHSREATVQHIDQTLPRNIPHQITARESLLECQKMIGGDATVIFTHVVLVLQSVPEIIAFMDQLLMSAQHCTTQLIIITDLNQRRQIIEAATTYDYEKLTTERRLQFIFKPLKPSKFGLIFDPRKEREMSTDRNQDSAHQVAYTQKQLYDEMTKRLGNRGKRVLLVEDNKVNQMVLLKFLGKVAVQVDTVLDGLQCTDRVFEMGHGYYSIILCDLHMPIKDGYQTCREIRRWEKENKYPYLPIIALSANVLGDVYAKCVDAGFNSYVTKPVDFKELSQVMLTFLDPSEPGRPVEFMKMRKK
ncbi:Peroxide stress-activated histidine kinase mak1 [Sphaceloma murrayae]|uniref:histidine kinase n=1 Tax=Sphaceloma murrayae TaxID=2082308 RepID=A0A2K1QR96_9PEZI|nr:Peroxide stress-activated histidine kinase mak1 [Sphaceloma murrayae]